MIESQIYQKNPGVYLFKDSDGKVIYVGKAKSLRDRATSYINPSDQSPKVKAMVSHARDIDFIVTNSAHEALVLENNLIKQYQPHYNILMRDDKDYSYLVVTREPFPRLVRTRNKESFSGHFFGPNTKGGSFKINMRTLRQYYPVRTCKLDLPEQQSRPCLDYHIGICSAPCNNSISQEDYNEIVSELLLLLSGRYKKLEKTLINQMEAASAKLKFEEAARYRESINQLHFIMESQRVVSDEPIDRDVFAVEGSNERACVEFMKVRSGRLILHQHFFAGSNFGSTLSEYLGTVMADFYSTSEGSDIPSEILVSNHPENERELLDFINEARTFKRKIKIIQPKRGDKVKLVEMAKTNAAHHLAEIHRREKIAVGNNAVNELKKLLDLKKLPVLIEGYDIANIQGKSAVGSQVTFKDGRPQKKGYRIYKIKSIDTPNDYQMMEEVLSRRKNRWEDEDFAEKPNLLVIDGGKGQLGVAEEIFKGVDVEIISLAKQEELVFVPGKSEPIKLDENGFALRLLKQIRDESHRFAGKHFRIQHKKRSGLDKKSK
ncbi:MAG: excinuclease ABC subunit UvrC [Caldisericia bacterium]